MTRRPGFASVSFARGCFGAALLAAFAAMLPSSARADFFVLDTVFNGSAPKDSGPWLTADFKTLSVGTVELTLTSNLTMPSEFISQVDFNLSTAFRPSTLSIVQSPVASPIPSSIVATSQNSQNLTGGGSAGKGFDIAIKWSTHAGSNRFDGTDTDVFVITAPGLTAEDFNFTNTGSASAYIAAHIQGIPGRHDDDTTSGAISATEIHKHVTPMSPTPEPSTLALAGLGGLTAVAYGWRKRKFRMG